MVFVVTQITNLEECRGSYLIAAEYKASVLPVSELQGVITSEVIVVEDPQLAQKTVERYHYEKDIKKSKISLASAFELVIQTEKEQAQTENSVVSQIIAIDTYDRLESSVYAAYNEAVQAERILINAIKNSSLDDEQEERKLTAADIKQSCLNLSREIISLTKTLRKGEAQK